MLPLLRETLAALDLTRRRALLGLLAASGVSAVLLAAEVVPDTQVVVQLVQGRNSFHSLALLGVFGLNALLLERAQRARGLIMGCVLELAFGALRAWLGWPLITGVGLGLGVFALAQRTALWARAAPPERAAHVPVLFDMGLVASFPALTAAFLSLTALVRPLTFDGFVFEAQRGFGLSLERPLIGLFAAAPAVKWASFTVYLALLAALAVVHGLQLRRDARRATTLPAFLLAGVVGYALYFVFPLAGPAFALSGVMDGGAWALPAGVMRPPPVPRNCMPSLHTTWALLIFFQARELGPRVRAVAGVFLLGTLLATLGLGFHYVVDLVIAAPFAVLVDAAVRPVAAGAGRARRPWLWAGAALVVGWLLLLRFASGLLGGTPGLLWLLAAGTLAFAVTARRALRDLPLAEPEDATAAPRPGLQGAALVGLAFVMSGLASIVYEVVFAKSLALTFGSTSLAQTAVLTTYMGGIGVGSWLGARWVARRADPLRVYALCEAGIAAWCLAAPLVLSGTQRLYVLLAGGSDPSSAGAVALQVTLSIGTLLVPTLLMGATTPALAQHFALQSGELGPSIRLLYGANTLGAGLGSLVTGYLLLPSLGIQLTLFVAVSLNLAAALVAWQLHRRARPERPEAAPVPPPVEPAPGQAAPSREVRLAAWCALAVLTVGGVGSLALEVLSVHLLAVVAGTSAYAFSLMLATFLLGLSLGAAGGARLKADGALAPVLGAQALLALSVLLGVFAWEQLPEYFLGFSGYARGQTFAERELVRMMVCVVALFPPAFFIGASYPLAMAVVVKAFPGRQVKVFGVASGLNTLGNIVGALGAHFVLVPRLGSLHSLQLLAAVALALAVVPLLLRAAPARPGVLVPLAAAAVAFALQPRAFDLNRLASGANVYFLSQGYGEVIDHAESSDGGFTTIARSVDKAGRPTLTMLTNGKFQGDDSPEREVPAQYGLALAPLLHSPARGGALVVGYGTGCSAAALHHAGFEQLDVVELSEDVMVLANKYFTSINDRVTEQPGVRTFVTDGRNFLLLREEQYDLVSMEISSIWFAGAAALYNAEFYDLVARRLKPQGVLQQWVQLHRLRPVDVASILTSVRVHFERVWLYFVRGQGVIVACNHDCTPSAANAAVIDGTPALTKPLAAWGGSSTALSQTMVLDPAGTDQFIAAVARDLKLDVMDLVSTDDNLKLEYSTPQANVRAYAASLQHNLKVLSKFGGRTTPDLRREPAE